LAVGAVIIPLFFLAFPVQALAEAEAQARVAAQAFEDAKAQQRRLASNLAAGGSSEEARRVAALERDMRAHELAANEAQRALEFAQRQLQESGALVSEQ
jgi:hypothetical protein